MTQITWHLERYYRAGTRLKKLGIPLQEASVPYGLEALDPTKRIQDGLEIDQKFYSALELKQLYGDKYTPLIQSCPLYLELKKIWQNHSEELALFDPLNPWEKLEFLELFFGLTTSHTTVEFQLIDLSVQSP